MNAAADVTPSSPQRISITTALTANHASAISNGRIMSDTTQSSQPTGDGAQSATACVGCGISLKPFEVYACTDCLNFWLMSDPNGLMGEDDE
ncbi:protein NinF [Pantoea ananatis]|uniref:protein NinF n=1 Tax=Pantoea ananas TaxID=553 RepID=UPI00099D1DB4